MLEVVPRWLRFVVGGTLVVVALGLLMVRTTGHDPARWHVDPLATERTGKPNDYLVAPADRAAARVDREPGVLAATPESVLARLDAVVGDAPRIDVVAGSVADLFITYVQRTPWIGFPDYISVRAIPADGGATLAIWSRSRYGYGDLGVNRARVEGWLRALDAS